MIPVTSGAAFVAGSDVTGDMANIRRTLGVCPQHDILYPDLTVREHLRMYAVLKGVPGKDLKEAISVRSGPTPEDTQRDLHRFHCNSPSVLAVSFVSSHPIPF